MQILSNHCPDCQSEQVKVHCRYQTRHHGERHIYHCQDCNSYFSDTVCTAIAGLRTPLSRVIQILKARTDGLGLNATARTFSVSKKSVLDWEWRLSDLKPTLLLYSLLHQFLHQVIEADELYTKVGKNTAASDSEGWTVVLMERGSRFLWDLHCGRKDQELFEAALTLLAKVIEKTGDLTLLSDGERRYGNVLFSICYQLLHRGGPGRPRKTLPKNIRVRLKNKGQKKRRGRPRPKYQAPVPEHPETKAELEDQTIHANHVEAFNAALRRRNSAFRRRTNTYAKTQADLQRTLNREWLIHNFVRPHFTTGLVPAVALGILETGLSWAQLFSIRYVV